MEFFETIIRRRSVRAFKKDPVEEWKINRLLEVANLAPSAGDLQAYEIIVVKDEDRKRRLSEAALGQEFITEAPVVFVFLSNPKRSARRYGKRGIDLYCLQDATIAASYLQLAATALGLGSVWVGAFNDEEVSKCVDVRELKPVAIIPVGYPDEEPMITPRRGVNNLAYSEVFGQPYQYKPTDKMFLRPQY